MAKSMTIDEMRQVHQQALREAEAKRTELRLVLASRYRELVGSSDEVIRMKERSQELFDLVHALPGLIDKLSLSSANATADSKEEEKTDAGLTAADSNLVRLRHDLSTLPRVVYRAVDRNDIHQAATTLIELFALIASQSSEYPLATVLARQPSLSARAFPKIEADIVKDHSGFVLLQTQMRMVFLQVQSLPRHITHIAEQNLLQAASYGDEESFDPNVGVVSSASALSALDWLLTDPQLQQDRATYLVDWYFNSKTKLLASLLSQLAVNTKDENVDDSEMESSHVGTDNAEEILSKIVLVLQYDVILHPFQIFVLRQLPTPHGESNSTIDQIVQTLPPFDAKLIRAKCSKFLAAHLPLIRTKVKSVLVTIAGTTASALGQIRQSLYDKTDGSECRQLLDRNGTCTWEEAVASMVDVHAVSSQTTDSSNRVPVDRQFSLWSALFSNTFSSLVHSLLTTAFQSVHAKVVSTLRALIGNAPPLSALLPHEAYRNALRIATQLDQDLLRVSDDAHELLVHAEEREESERRLKQSLYVQTSEIMGRLICELRRMVAVPESLDAKSQRKNIDATKELIVGRLCHLLKFRLTALPTLLDATSAADPTHHTMGMISYVDLQSAFDLADDNNDGLISLDEAMEAVESAFSGTPFRGGEMIRDTLLLTKTGGGAMDQDPHTAHCPSFSVTLHELVLLTARGLRHDTTGSQSALGTIQLALDDIVGHCFDEWAQYSVSGLVQAYQDCTFDVFASGSEFSEEEWRRIYAPDSTNVSPHVVGAILEIASILNQSTCPPDSLPPVPSSEYASKFGVAQGAIATLRGTVRAALLQQSLSFISSILQTCYGSLDDLDTLTLPALLQVYADVVFLRLCFFERNQFGYDDRAKILVDKSLALLEAMIHSYKNQLCSRFRLDEWEAVSQELARKYSYVLGATDLFTSTLFGQSDANAFTDGHGLDSTSDFGGESVLFHLAPLPSSRRFILLSVQADRSLEEIQLRGKNSREKINFSNSAGTGSGGVMSSGLGFLSSMLKKK
jgi:hypothetical protein